MEPRGIFSARVDEKGRLKLAAPVQKYIHCTGDRRVFVTSLDNATVQIYPISIWESNECLFENFLEDPEGAEIVAFTAHDNGADCELDDQGRLLIHQKLRHKLGMEGEPVWLHCYKGVIHVYGKEIYEARKRQAEEKLAEKLRVLKGAGLR